MQNKLIDSLLAMEKTMNADYAAGQISPELTAEIRRIGYQLECYCSSRRLHFRNNKMIRKAWRGFLGRFAVSLPKKPIKCYEFSQISKPSDFGLDAEIEKILCAVSGQSPE